MDRFIYRLYYLAFMGLEVGIGTSICLVTDSYNANKVMIIYYVEYVELMLNDYKLKRSS